MLIISYFYNLTDFKKNQIANFKMGTVTIFFFNIVVWHFILNK